jgi:hypothetical protein
MVARTGEKRSQKRRRCTSKLLLNIDSRKYLDTDPEAKSLQIQKGIFRDEPESWSQKAAATTTAKEPKEIRRKKPTASRVGQIAGSSAKSSYKYIYEIEMKGKSAKRDL